MTSVVDPTIPWKMEVQRSVILIQITHAVQQQIIVVLQRHTVIAMVALIIEVWFIKYINGVKDNFETICTARLR